jgi:C1A family cysteine protease
MTIVKRSLGWIPDLPDHRDKKYDKYRLHLEKRSTLPSKIDLRTQFPVKPFEQGDLGSCVAQAMAAALMFGRSKQKLAKFMPSRLFIYYNSRALDGDVTKDYGTTIRSAIKSVATHGFAHESAWKYDVASFAMKPPANVYADGKKFYSTKYYSIDNSNINSIKTCLSAGYPIMIGYTLYESFYEADSNGGFVPMPTDSKLEGGHCVLLVGYDDATERFIVRNSWGKSAGDGTGHYYMPYEYLTSKDLADDFWTIRAVSQDGVDKPLP